jgi:hypothetical protein
MFILRDSRGEETVGGKGIDIIRHQEINSENQIYDSAASHPTDYTRESNHTRCSHVR